MKRWLLAGAAMLTLGNAAEPELSSSRFGEFEVTAIQDAATTMRQTLFAALPEQEFRRLAGGDAAPASVNVFLLKRNGKQILADTGYGGSRGALTARLGQLEIAPEKIDFILLTHMHGDHIGGLIDAAGKAVFPTTTILVSAPELAFWQKASGSGGELARKVLTAYAGRVKSFQYGDEVLPGIRALDAAGHTPGHTVFDTGSLLIVGDLLHAAAIQLPKPELCASYDMDPEKSVQTRRRFLDLAADAKRPVAGMHLPAPGIVLIHRSGNGYTATSR